MARLPKFAREHVRCLADDDDPYCFYHATPDKNVDAIMRDGLLPGSGTVFQTADWSTSKLFLAYGYAAGCQWQGFVYEMTGEPVTLLEVRLTPAQMRAVQVDEVSRAEGDACSFYITHPIAPHQLRIVDSGATF